MASRASTSGCALVIRRPGDVTPPESLERHAAEDHSPEDKRNERLSRGYVHFKAEKMVPDVGGVGWRTINGHMLKNNAYYACPPKTNKWDLPIHAGYNTWKEFHGPRLRTDAPMMERLDNFDHESDQWEAKKCFVNTTRAQTVDRYYNRKLNRDQLESSQVWAPHRRAGREVHDCHEHFFGDIDSRPQKELKKLLPAKVLQLDRDGIRTISKKIQNEESWKLAWRHMELERRHDVRHNFRQRQSYNDLLMQLSGQPVRERDWEHNDLRLNNCSQETEALAKGKECPVIADVTNYVDFRGMFHADNEHALEALFPGTGHELSVEFRRRCTESTQAGWPAPPAAETPRDFTKGKRALSEKTLQKDAQLTSERSPVARSRLESVGTRGHDNHLKSYAKEQFRPHNAPPPPNQKDLVLKDDFSPKTMLADPGRVTGSFQRTEQALLPHNRSTSKHKQGGKTMEHLPPAQRPYTYPVLTCSSPTAKGAQAEATYQFLTPDMGSPMSTFHSSVSSPNKRGSNASSVFGNSSPKRRTRSASILTPEKEPSSAVCRELDKFEASMTCLPRVSNFFDTPRSHLSRASPQKHSPGEYGAMEEPPRSKVKKQSPPQKQSPGGDGLAAPRSPPRIEGLSRNSSAPAFLKAGSEALRDQSVPVLGAGLPPGLLLDSSY